MKSGTTYNTVKIHTPDGIHGWGIEYNHTPEDMNTSAEVFTATCCRRLLQPGSGWFWQSGSDRPNAGYQFFEYLGANPEDTVKTAAQDIANAIKADVE